MQEHYLNVVESVDNLKSTVQKSSLNRMEFNMVRSALHEIYEQTLPNTLTWVPEEKEPEEPIQKKVARTFLTPFKEQLDKLRL